MNLKDQSKLHNETSRAFARELVDSHVVLSHAQGVHVPANQSKCSEALARITSRVIIFRRTRQRFSSNKQEQEKAEEKSRGRNIHACIRTRFLVGIRQVFCVGISWPVQFASVMKVNYSTFHKSRTRARHTAASSPRVRQFGRNSRGVGATLAQLPLQLARTTECQIRSGRVPVSPI